MSSEYMTPLPFPHFVFHFVIALYLLSFPLLASFYSLSYLSLYQQS